MSIANTPNNSVLTDQLWTDIAEQTPTSHWSEIRDVLERVQAKIAPVWPLKDYVAVNPYLGLTDQEFLDARSSLRAVSDLECLMPVNYYRELFAKHLLSKSDISAAVDELVADGVTGAERIDVNQVVALLLEEADPTPTADTEFRKSGDPNRPLRTLTELLDRHNGSHWSRVIGEEVSKHCAAHYDEGQAVWSSPWQDLPLYQAWRSAARHDRSPEILGITGFRRMVAALPHQPHAAVSALLRQLQVPTALWEDFLHCVALTMPGWSAWARYQDRKSDDASVENSDFVGLLAIRLAYDVALSSHFAFEVNWHSVAEQRRVMQRQTTEFSDEDLLHYALLRSSEIAYRGRVLSDLSDEQTLPADPGTTDRSLAQMVFCIDVRSERIRRHIEATSSGVETFGFAGFFGLPIEFVPLGESEGTAQVPVLISPQIQIHEGFDATDKDISSEAVQKRTGKRFLRKAWKELQSSAVSCFAFVEATGLLFAPGLIARSLGFGQLSSPRCDGVSRDEQQHLGPSLRGLSEQGVTETQQVDMAESILRGIGIVDQFARVVVFCGHGSQTENNPLQAGLDCGACGGHSGEANARVAARLLNQPFMRQALAGRGIDVPEDTVFVAALHNTTTDEISLLDSQLVPASHDNDLRALKIYTGTASERTRTERLAVLPGATTTDLLRRSRDWSEIRPEWGLAGNAAFVAAPRQLSKSISLDGRSFLHSYDYRKDPEFAVLEQIMTAPLVVAHWINMQYYASTVDPVHFGSGNKAVHNVVGQFGIFSGNGGDLMTGLPWQSVHDGTQYQHHPLRLLAVIAAPREAIASIIARHDDVRNLVVNGWLQLIAIDGDGQYRFTERQTWDALHEASFAASK